MNKFNIDQQRAIEHSVGPALIIAGPGSGKTTVIIQRIARLTQKEHILPRHILAITFTKAAAEEMENRYVRLTGIKSEDNGKERVTFGTFHSVFLSALKKYVKDFTPRLASHNESLKILKHVVSAIYPDKTYTADYYSELLSSISKKKNSTIGNCEDFFGSDQLKRIISEYDSLLHASGLIDFDDMLLLMLRLIKRDERVLYELRNSFRYLILDEFQDINKLQFEIIKLIGAPNNNVFAVGDDDQSIYGFRGSDPSIMLSFKNYYHDAEIITLRTNYRSDETIVNASLKLIAHNKNRYKKELKAARSGGKGIDIRGFYGLEECAHHIILDIKGHCGDKTYAVLFRTHRAGTKAAAIIAANDLFREGNISLMTFHASKGLEFDVVYIIEAMDKITPGINRCITELEEERRMFYVAMTRAKEELHIFYTKNFYNTFRKRSRFINEID